MITLQEFFTSTFIVEPVNEKPRTTDALEDTVKPFDIASPLDTDKTDAPSTLN